MRHEAAPAGTLLLVIILAILVTASRAQVDSNRSAAAWKEDLHFLAKELPVKHKNLYHTLTQADFNRAVADLDARMSTLPAETIALEFKRLAAMAGDGHTRVRLTQPMLGFRQFPIVLFMYPNGLHVIRAVPQYRQAIGARVLRIGSATIQEVLAAVRPFVSRDNDMSEMQESTVLVTMPQLLHALGFTTDPQRARFLLEDEHGQDFTVEFTAAQNLDLTKLANVWDLSGMTPIRWDGNEKNYWWKYIDASKTLYMQYNVVLNDGQRTLEQFFKEFFQFADSHPVERFVIDLRNNIGGNGSLNKPLIDGFRKRNVFGQPQRLFVIIGRRTFSAGLMAAIDLKHGRFFREKSDPVMEKQTRTILVGEPTGGKPNSYSELGELKLPRSGIVVNYSKLFWELAPEMGNSPSLAPDVLVEPSLEADRSGKDAAIDKILSLREN